MRSSVTALTISCLTAATAWAGTYSFQTINNPGDPNFNQLLGINNEGTIAGYFGDGMGIVPNNGYTWTKAGGFVAENFPHAAQTQVVAINNVGVSPPVGPAMYNTAGFYVDAAGATTASQILLARLLRWTIRLQLQPHHSTSFLG